MKIEEGNANKKIIINKQFSISIILVLVIFMISGSAATMSYAAPQTLPSCTDPTGQNLRCMMVISTLPPPPNALQCQETSGQILPCSYTTQNLNNGEQIVAITVYVPTNFVFSSPTLVKVVVHETTTKTTITKTRTVYEPCPPGQKLNPETRKCVDVPPCNPGQHLIFVGRFVCVPPFRIIHCTPLVPCPPPPTCDSKYYTGPCPPIDPNAYLKCASAALAANDMTEQLRCAKLLPDNPDNVYLKCASAAAAANDITAQLKCAKYLPDTPENAYIKCASAAAAVNDLNAELKCAKLLPSPTQNAHNLTNTTAGAAAMPPSNTSAAIQPTNTSIPTPPSGGKGTGSTCAAGNCTTGTPPPVDCTKIPTDPSCTQTLTPSTTTPPSTSGTPTSPTTKTCPDGSVIDASATCPTPSTIPNTPPPPSSSTPPPTPPSNNPGPPSSSNNGGGGSGSGSGGSGSGSGGGSSPSQPTTVS